MRFPTGTDVTRLRSRHGNRSRVYLGVQRGKELADIPPPLMVGMHYRLTANDVYSATAHTLTFVGNFLDRSDIRPNMTLAVGTLADPYAYGSARIRRVDAANNQLCLEMNNLSTWGYLVAGNYIWVDGVYRLYRILPRVVAGVMKEDGNWDDVGGVDGIPGRGIAWSREYYYRPVALMGSPRFAFAGEPINFYGWRSHGRGGRNIVYHTWDFDGGTCLGPGVNYAGSPANPIRVRWNTAGEYIASLVVQDDGGDTGLDAYGVRFDQHRAVRPVLVFDRPGQGDNPPYTDFKVESLTGRYGSGWSCRITVYGTADKSEFPDNALIILFAEDWHGGTQGSIGGWYGQEGILFVGHVRADSVAVDSEKSTVTFEAQTIEQWMKDISVWPANFSSPVGGGSNTWHQYNNMTVEDILWHLAGMHSTLKNVTDCYFASDVGVEKQVHFLDLTEASLYDQMSSQIGSCFFGRLSAGRHGSVHLCKHKNMMDLSERIWWGPPVYSFRKQDWRDELEIGEERMRDSVAQVDFAGFVYNATGDPLDVFSLAPARQNNFGRIEKVTGVLLTGNSIVLGQPENNAFAGLYLAWKNTRFPHIRVPAGNNRILEPAEQDYFAVVLAADDTERGYVWPGKEFLTMGMSIDVDNDRGIILVDVEGEASTWGPDGVAGEYPYDPPSGNPPDGNPPGPWPVWPPPFGDEDSSNLPPWGEEPEDGSIWPITVYMGLWSGHVIRGIGMGPSVRWQNRCTFHNCGQVHSDGIYWMALDEFDSVNTAMVATRHRVYRTTNLGADAPDWELVLGPITGLNGGTLELTMVQSSPLQQDLWMVAGYEPAGAASIYIFWTTTGGASWSTTNFTSGNTRCSAVFLEMSTHDADRAWAVWVDCNDDRTYIAETNNMWTTQALTAIPLTCYCEASDWYHSCHHRDYQNDDDSEVLYGGTHWTAPASTNYARLYRNGVCTTLHSAASPSYPDVPRVGCGVGTLNRWWALATNATDEASFWISDDGVSWSKQSDWTRSGTTEARDCRNMRRDWRAYVVARDGIAYPVRLTDNRGATWHPQWGGIEGVSWTDFLTAEGLGSPDVMCVCSPSLLP